MAHHNDRSTSITNSTDQFYDELFASRVEACRRFVQQPCPRVVLDQQAGQGEALEHTARVRSSRPTSCLVEADALQCRIPFFRFKRSSVERRDEVQVLATGKVWVDEWLVKDDPEASAYIGWSRTQRAVVAEDLEAPLGRFQLAGHNPHKRALSRAIVADDGGDLARLEPGVELSKCPLATEAAGQSLRHNKGVTGDVRIARRGCGVFSPH